MSAAPELEPAAPAAPHQAPHRAPPWWRRMDLIATTSTVLVVSGIVLWRSDDARNMRDSIAIGSALVVYPASLALLATRARGTVRLPIFLGAGLAAGSVGQLIDGKFMIDRELGVAAATGAFVGLAHWLAARAWTRLIGSETV